MTSDELKIAIETMIANEGIYLLADSEIPGAYAIAVSKRGKLYAMEIAQELTADRFTPSAMITTLAVTQLFSSE